MCIRDRGTTSIITDWKTGRNIHCMSQGEAMWYFLLRWDDSNIDIREQLSLIHIYYRMTLMVLLFIPVKAVIMKHFAKKRKRIMDEFITESEKYAGWFALHALPCLDNPADSSAR